MYYFGLKQVTIPTVTVLSGVKFDGNSASEWVKCVNRSIVIVETNLMVIMIHENVNDGKIIMVVIIVSLGW
jgi:hypothetical protein